MTEALVQYTVALPPMPAGALCEACGWPEMLVRDHCHEHGWVRGIVCRRCNMYLGRIDRRIAPGAQEEHLAALLVVKNRCPDCSQLNAADLAHPERPESPEPRVVWLSDEPRARENRLRRMADRQGYSVSKPRGAGIFRLAAAKGEPKEFSSVDALEEFLTW